MNGRTAGHNTRMRSFLLRFLSLFLYQGIASQLLPCQRFHANSAFSFLANSSVCEFIFFFSLPCHQKSELSRELLPCQHFRDSSAFFATFSRLARPALQHHAHCSIGEMQIVNRPRKEGPSKNVMLLSQKEGCFEECDAAKPRKNMMQVTQVSNAQNKVHIVLQLNC